ncbi:MAG: phosphate acyltransferase [Lawsonibacter sp.]
METVSPAMPETGDACRPKEKRESGETSVPVIVEGPISLDLATDREAALVKGYHSPVAGDADILLVPSIAAGNRAGQGPIWLGRRPDGRCGAGRRGPYHHQLPWGRCRRRNITPSPSAAAMAR